MVRGGGSHAAQDEEEGEMLRLRWSGPSPPTVLRVEDEVGRSGSNSGGDVIMMMTWWWYWRYL